MTRIGQTHFSIIISSVLVSLSDAVLLQSSVSTVKLRLLNRNFLLSLCHPPSLEGATNPVPSLEPSASR